jgi:hypothetical protein
VWPEKNRHLNLWPDRSETRPPYAVTTTTSSGTRTCCCWAEEIGEAWSRGGRQAVWRSRPRKATLSRRGLAAASLMAEVGNWLQLKKNARALVCSLARSFTPTDLPYGGDTDFGVPKDDDDAYLWILLREI